MPQNRKPLHLTKVAYGASDLDEVRGWFATRGSEVRLTTRYAPRRIDELVGGSLFWILRHQLVARSPLLGFAEEPDGRTAIRLANRLITVDPRPRRAHQGWRYLTDEDAPADLGEGISAAVLPAALASELARLGL